MHSKKQKGKQSKKNSVVEDVVGKDKISFMRDRTKVDSTFKPGKAK